LPQEILRSIDHFMTVPNKVTAGILLIGDELLSGRTQDVNLATIAKFLEPLGVQVAEARILSDNADVIRGTVKEFADKFDYVFTTGGIGPTHDDITADCIAAAFGLDILPDGASLIKNPVSQAPGFQTRNVFTLAGVPQIMRGMLADISHRIEGGAKVFQITVSASGIGEGDAAAPLAEIESAYPGVSIGSYPWFNDDLRGVNFVARGIDETTLALVKAAIEKLVLELNSEQA